MLRALIVASCFLAVGWAQEADSGISMPVTASFGAMDTHRFDYLNPSASAAAASFRLMLYPALRLGKHWFAYAAVEVRRLPYFYYDAYLPEHDIDTDLIQGYVGYALRRGAATIVFKAGQMVTAFGSFPLRYDDMANPLMDQQLAYITEIPLRSNQLSCGTSDLLKQHYGYVISGCGGASGGGPGLTPVTLYGVPAAQAELSWRRFDARLQVSSSTPVFTQVAETVSGEYLQWAAGGGFTIQQGFRIGVSGFRGPYLDSAVSSALPSGTTVRSFPATGRGLDVQWARGRWSANGELQDFQFNAPNYVVPPRVLAGYAELKARVTPRLFAATREGFLKTESVLDSHGVSASEFAPTLRATEVGLGYWLNPRVLAKVSYEWMQAAGSSGTKSNVLGLQVVARFDQLQWGWK